MEIPTKVVRYFLGMTAFLLCSFTLVRQPLFPFRILRLSPQRGKLEFGALAAQPPLPLPVGEVSALGAEVEGPLSHG